MAKGPGNQNSVGKLYQTVIDDVINNIREAFLDDGVDEQVLQELKHTWEAKLVQSKAVENPAEQHRSMQSTALPMYTQQVVYRTIPDGQAGIQMTAAGQQAAVALPGHLIYQQKLPMASTAPAQIYTAYQPAHQISHQPNTQPVIIAAQRQEPNKSSGSQQPSVIIQVDGSSDQDSVPSCSTSDVASSSRRLESQRACDEQLEIEIKIPKKFRGKKLLPQVDGNMDSSDDDDTDDDDDEDDDDEDDDEDEEGKESKEVVDDEPLCSDDDGTDEDPVELFDTDNVIVCQYDKIHRAKNRWKFNLKVGIMNLNGKDYVFQKATGEANW